MTITERKKPGRKKGYKATKRYFSDKARTGIEIPLTKEKDPVALVNNKLSYNARSFHCKYSKASEGDETLPKLSYSQYLKFLKTYFYGIVERIVFEGFIFIMPYYLGRLYFRKSNRRGFVGLKQTLNLHTFRKFYSLKWDKETAYFKNRTLWRYGMRSYSKVCVMKAIKDYNKPILDAPLIAHDHNESKWT